MVKLGAGVVLVNEVKEGRKKTLEFYLIEDVPSFQGVMVDEEDIFERMSFESWNFFRTSNLVCRYKENALFVETKSYYNLLKVLPFVVEEVLPLAVWSSEITPSAVWFSPESLLYILEDLETEFENPAEKLKETVSFFFGDVEFRVVSKEYFDVTYYVTVWQEREIALVTKKEISKHKDEKIAEFLKGVRESALYEGKTHEHFIRELKCLKGE